MRRWIDFEPEINIYAKSLETPEAAFTEIITTTSTMSIITAIILYIILVLVNAITQAINYIAVIMNLFFDVITSITTFLIYEHFLSICKHFDFFNIIILLRFPIILKTNVTSGIDKNISGTNFI